MHCYDETKYKHSLQIKVESCVWLKVLETELNKNTDPPKKKLANLIITPHFSVICILSWGLGIYNT